MVRGREHVHILNDWCYNIESNAGFSAHYLISVANLMVVRWSAFGGERASGHMWMHC